MGVGHYPGVPETIEDFEVLFEYADSTYALVYPNLTTSIQVLTPKETWVPAPRREFDHLGTQSINYIFNLASRIEQRLTTNKTDLEDYYKLQSELGCEIGCICYARISNPTDLGEEFIARRVLLFGQKSGFEIVYIDGKAKRVIRFTNDLANKSFNVTTQLEVDEKGNVMQYQMVNSRLIQKDRPQSELITELGLYVSASEFALRISFGKVDGY